MNAVRRTAERPIRRQEATILRLPIETEPRLQAAADSTGETAAEDSAGRSGHVLTSVLLAVLLVMVCLAWEVLSGGF